MSVSFGRRRGGLAVDIEGRRGRRPPGELGRPAQPGRRAAGPGRSMASMIALAMDAGSPGLASTAAPPAVSGIALVSEVTTGQPVAIASRIGSPNVSLCDGYANTSAAR